MRNITKIILFLIFVIAFGGVFASFYFKLTILDFNKFNLKIRDMEGRQDFNLPSEQAYMLKIWGDDTIDKVYFNNNSIVHSVYRHRKVLKEFYYLLSPDCTNYGRNTITIFPDHRYTFRLMNYVAATNFGVIVFNNSSVERIQKTYRQFFSMIFFFAVIIILIFILLHLFFNLSFCRFIFFQAISYIPCVLILFLLNFINDFFIINVYFIKNSYFSFCSFLIICFQMPLLFYVLSKNINNKEKSNEINQCRFTQDYQKNCKKEAKKQSTGGIPGTKVQGPIFLWNKPKHYSINSSEIPSQRQHTFIPGLKAGGSCRWVKNDPIKKPLFDLNIVAKVQSMNKKCKDELLGNYYLKIFFNYNFSDKCLIIFIFLLFFSALLLSFRIDFLASLSGNIAYFALIAGIVSKLIKNKNNACEK